MLRGQSERIERGSVADPRGGELPRVSDSVTRGDRAWLVVQTHPGKERFAVENLQRQSFLSYCPMVQKRAARPIRGNPGTGKDVIRPLFPGYVFVETSCADHAWRPLLSTYGVRTLIRFGSRIGSVDPRFIEALRGREVGGLVALPDAPYAVGDRVTIRGGPFDGVVATILSMSEKDRLVVLMDILSRPVKVRIAVTQAEPLAAAS